MLLLVESRGSHIKNKTNQKLAAASYALLMHFSLGPHTLSEKPGSHSSFRSSHPIPGALAKG